LSGFRDTRLELTGTRMLGAKESTDKTLLSKYNNTIAVRERQSGEDDASETRGKDVEEE
jgi:hypothetical protein